MRSGRRRRALPPRLGLELTHDRPIVRDREDIEPLSPDAASDIDRGLAVVPRAPERAPAAPRPELAAGERVEREKLPTAGSDHDGPASTGRESTA